MISSPQQSNQHCSPHCTGWWFGARISAVTVKTNSGPSTPVTSIYCTDPESINSANHLGPSNNFSIGVHGLVITCPIKCVLELLIRSQNFNSCIVDVWKLISNLIPRFIMSVITSPYLDLNEFMLVKGRPNSWWMSKLIDTCTWFCRYINQIKYP